MSSVPSLQQRFEEQAEQYILSANSVLERGDDINSIELQIERLSFLLSMYSQIQQHYDQETFLRRLNMINFLKRRLEQRIEFLKQDSSSARKNFVQIQFTGGRPKNLINESAIRLLRQHGYSWSKIGQTFGLSLPTIMRRKYENNIPDTIPQYSNLTNDELDEIVKSIKRESPFFGLCMIMGSLRSKGFRITRQRVAESIRRVDSIGVVIRWSSITPRRVYRVAGPNALWHLDGHHKLIRWKFVIHAAIDGYSRLITFIHCNTNNKASTVFRNFKEGIDSFGVPSRIRADCGGENVLVNQFMNEYRGEGRGSFIAGRSIHNQRIERLWVDVIKDVVKIYTTIFIYLEDKHGMDINNNMYLFCLHYVFLPRINQTLSQWKTSWNNHCIRTANNQTPLQMFIKGMIESGFRGFEDENVNPYEYGIDWQGPTPNEDDNSTVIVNEVCNVLTQTQLNLLRAAVNPLELDEDGYGVNVYKKTVDVVAQILRNQ